MSHCIADLQSGSLELADCLLRVEELIAVCRTMASVAALGSKHVLAGGRDERRLYQLRGGVNGFAVSLPFQ